MPLNITADINGERVVDVRVRNQGHPIGGGHPEDDDLRSYGWVDRLTGRGGTVLHRRRLGAERLAADVLYRIKETADE